MVPKAHEEHWITFICPRKDAMSLAVSIDEVHDLSNFSQGAGFKLVFSLDFFKPVLYLELTHGKGPRDGFEVVCCAFPA
jgi:hypothetical protein